MYELSRKIVIALIALMVTTIVAQSVNAAEQKKIVFKGKATVTTVLYGMPFKSTGAMKLKITSLDARGRVKADVEFYNGLLGEGKVSGTIDRTGKLRLEGTLQSFLEYDFTIRAVLGDKRELTGKYTLVYNHGFGSKSVQDGKFELEYDDD